MVFRTFGRFLKALANSTARITAFFWLVGLSLQGVILLCKAAAFFIGTWKMLVLPLQVFHVQYCLIAHACYLQEYQIFLGSMSIVVFVYWLEWMRGSRDWKIRNSHFHFTAFSKSRCTTENLFLTVQFVLNFYKVTGGFGGLNLAK